MKQSADTSLTDSWGYLSSRLCTAYADENLASGRLKTSVVINVGEAGGGRGPPRNGGPRRPTGTLTVGGAIPVIARPNTQVGF